jgi:LPS export ABC transporter protein LptC
MSAPARRIRRVAVGVATGLAMIHGASRAPAADAGDSAMLSAAEPQTADVVKSERASPELRFTSLTFVGSHTDQRELVLRSTRGTYRPDRDVADLEDVNVVVTNAGGADGFTTSCDRAEVDLATHDFRAEGNVRGVTAKGQHFSAPYVVYDHAAGVLSTDAPVSMRDSAGTFSGSGFRYDVERRSFKLLGNVSVERGP